MCLSCPLLCLVGLLCLTGLSAFTTEEQALLQFAKQISGFDVSYQGSRFQAVPGTVCMHALFVFGKAVFPAASRTYYTNTTAFSISGVFQEVYKSSHWQGWGKDSNILCPATEVITDNEYLCFPNYPGEINATSQSWTGVVCTPNGTVLCLSLPGWGLTGSVSALEELVPLHDMQLLNLANNSLTGTCCQHCRQLSCSVRSSQNAVQICRFLARYATSSAQ